MSANIVYLFKQFHPPQGEATRGQTTIKSRVGEKGEEWKRFLPKVWFSLRVIDDNLVLPLVHVLWQKAQIN